jgi:hypothetical protein
MDGNAVEVGVKFRSDVSGFITGVRFYKASNNTGTHVGHLWTRDGVLLASATFTGETASGWQQVTFPNAIAISPGVTYVASYLAPVGHYSYNDLFFATSDVDNPPLHALQDGTDGGNGVFTYGAAGAFPTTTYRSRGYSVDVVFASTVGGASGPSVTAFSPGSGATGVALTAPVTITFNKAISASTVTTSRFQLLDASQTAVAANLSYNPSNLTVTMVPSFGLDYGGTYTVTVVGGSGGVLDTSGNPMTSTVNWKFTATAAPPGSCPCSVWPSTAVPATPDSGDGAAYELGVKFRSDSAGFITSVRFYKSAANTGTHVAHLWGRDGTLLATATFTSETPSGWQQVNFPSAIAIAANTTYIASYTTSSGHYAMNDLFFATTGQNAPPLHLLQDGTDGGNGTYGAWGSFPGSSYRSRYYWVDAVFVTNVGGVFGPNVTAVVPASGSGGVGPGAQVSATFSKPLNPSTVTSATFALYDSANNPVSGSLAYNASTSTATFTPAGALAPASSYRAAVAGGLGGITDSSGNPLRYGVEWRFGTCCAIWSSSVVPSTVDSGDASALELGVKFRSDSNGFLTGVRFYKSAANTGTHTGHLWTRDGTLLATAAFGGETASGWQQASFPRAIAISVGTTYVISYTAPSGHYSMDDLYFANAGADNPPLHALADGTDGVNAVFGAPGSFPTSSSRSRNYWVDAVYMNTVGGATGPNVTAISPASAATGISPVASITATFSSDLNQATITTSTFQVLDSSQNPVSASVTYNSSTRTATLVPSFGLNYNTTYTVLLTGGSSGIKDTAGNGMATGVAWNFSTAAPPPGSCPCTIWPSAATPRTVDSGDGTALELGVRFHADVNGFISGVRFYKSAANTGTHVAHLWTAGGVLLASAPFTNETPSGWQQATFPSTVAIAAGSDYIASYSTATGHYSVDDSFFASAGVDNGPLHASQNAAGRANGVYALGAGGVFPAGSYNSRNYWVDVVLLTNVGGMLGPTVSSVSPASGATGVSPAAAVNVVFDRAMNASTITGSTVRLTDSSNAQVPATVSYNSSTFTATLTPSAALLWSASYAASVAGGVSGIRDSNGYPMQYGVNWMFTIAPPPPGTCPCSAWPPNATPGRPDSGDPGAVTLGAKFRTDVNGWISAVRFYKAAANTGTHIGYLWDSAGTLLASVTFSGETASGWQQMNFSSPVPVTAGTTYIISYYAPNGHYSGDLSYFAATGVDNGPLHLLKDGTDGPDGVFIYGAPGSLPSNTYSSSNYWVDVVFKTSL